MLRASISRMEQNLEGSMTRSHMLPHILVKAIFMSRQFTRLTKMESLEILLKIQPVR